MACSQLGSHQLSECTRPVLLEALLPRRSCHADRVPAGSSATQKVSHAALTALNYRNYVSKMRRPLSLVIASIALGACNLGASNYPVVAVTVAATQPADPVDGVLVDIFSYCGDDRSSCLLQIGIIGGQVLRTGDSTPLATFCQNHEDANLRAIMFPASGRSEAIVQARLLDGKNPSSCDGALLSETEAVVAAHMSRALDAGGADAK